MTLIEALAEKAARGELSPSEQQEALATLLRDLAIRSISGGVVTGSQDEIPTRPNPSKRG